MTIGAWLSEATKELVDAGIDTARLDAEIILAHTIKHPRTYLHAHPDKQLDQRAEEIANARLDLRLDDVPIAYIIGHKEFYGRRFYVSPAVLVPRPESEQVIELLTHVLPATSPLLHDNPKRLVDIGTGSGILGITAKLEYPELDVTLLDISKAALNVAKRNARSLDATVTAMESDLLDSYPYVPDIILANLPYVDRAWQRSPETAHEPGLALFAEQHGLALIDQCLRQLSNRQKPGGHTIFEADPRQWDHIETTARKNSFRLIERLEYAALFQKT